MRQACAIVSITGDKGEESVAYHALNMAMALVDTSGFVYQDGHVFNDTSWNYVVWKWTHAIPSTISFLVTLDVADGLLIGTMPSLEPWKVIQFFGTFVVCLGNVVLATRCLEKVKIMAARTNADEATMTEINQDLTGLKEQPRNTCCICLGVNVSKCVICGISCYCSKQPALWILSELG
jgi:hypothetical protein